MGYRTGLESTEAWLNRPRVRNPDTGVENRSRFLTVSMAPWGRGPTAEKGQLVLVMEGPLRGVIGVVEATQKRKIVVSIELVGRAVSATLDADAVAPYLDK